MWSARWTGTLTPAETGLYRFSLAESGMATLKIAGQTFGPAYREATQFIVGPHYALQGTVRLTAQAGAGRDRLLGISGLFSQEIHFGWQVPSQSGIPAAVAAARQADVAIVFANDAQGEGMDRTSLSLPGDQDQLIDAVAAANRRTIVVLNTGGPVLMPWLGAVDGVLEAWYPGQAFGTAIAAVLFGDADPAGRLPVTFPASDTQGPAPVTQPGHYPGVTGDGSYDEGLDVGYRWYDATGQRPLFPFGYGLSYESFAVSGVTRPTTGPAAPPPWPRGSRTPPGGPARPRWSSTWPRPRPRRSRPSSSRATPTWTSRPGRARSSLFRLTASDLAYYDRPAAGSSSPPAATPSSSVPPRPTSATPSAFAQANRAAPSR